MIERRPFARVPVSVVVAVVAAALGATVNQYGYHRDELYFRLLAQHPALSYVDEPPLTPMLVRASTSIFGDSLWALRLPAIISAVVTVVIVALIARELGGGRSAQIITAIGVSSTFLLISGHVLLTSSPDMVSWTVTILLILRALLRDEPRWWIWAGVAVGLSFWNKQLILLLLIGLVAGLLIAGPRRVLVSRWVWIAVAIAVVLALPTFIWQISNGFPELHMAHAISVDKGGNDRATFVPFQLVLLGVGVLPIWIAGLIGLFREPVWRPVCALGWAYVVVSVIVLVTGAQIYYTFGLLALYLAAGCVRAERWVAAGGRARPALIVAGLVITAVSAAPLGLPLVPVRTLPKTPIPGLIQPARDSVGWPAYVREVDAAFNAVPASSRERTTLIAENYGEAGALDKFGGAYGLPRVYSGQNQLYRYGPPPASATDAIIVGDVDPNRIGAGFASCVKVGSLDNNVGVDNEEQGNPIYYCTGRTESWSTLWPTYQHYS